LTEHKRRKSRARRKKLMRLHNIIRSFRKKRKRLELLQRARELAEGKRAVRVKTKEEMKDAGGI